MKRLILAAVMLVTGTGCASGNWFHFGPRPPELVGTWIDSARATPTDTFAWVLKANGDDQSLHISIRRDATGAAVLKQLQQRDTQWYLSRSLTGASQPKLCFKRRARDGGMCVRFKMDTLTSGSGRRLHILGDADRDRLGDRILEERTP